MDREVESCPGKSSSFKKAKNGLDSELWNSNERAFLPFVKTEMWYIANYETLAGVSLQPMPELVISFFNIILNVL
jgi:hypothetical protein